MCMAAAHSWQVIAGLRFLLGILEASFAPGVLFLLSAWYKKGELGRRYSVYYTAVALSGMFGGLIAGGLLQKLDGTHGISGWRWLFIVEGAGTCLVSVGALFALPDFPSTTRWLTPDERALASRRLAGDSLGDTQDGETIHHKVALKMALADWRTWAFVLTYMATTGAQTIQYFIPELVKVCQVDLEYSLLSTANFGVPLPLIVNGIHGLRSAVLHRTNLRLRLRGHPCFLFLLRLLQGTSFPSCDSLSAGHYLLRYPHWRLE